MKEITHQVNYITEYLGCYKQKIGILNKIGLFDEAKHFELFAIFIFPITTRSAIMATTPSPTYISPILFPPNI